MHSPFLACSANDERSMYSYTDDGMAATDSEFAPMPVDAAAALAAAFGIGFEDMANERESPLDRIRSPLGVEPPVEQIPVWQNGEERLENERSTPPLDAAAALAASFGIGFDFGGARGEGYGVSTPFVKNANVGWSRAQSPRHPESVGQSPGMVDRVQEEITHDEPPVDAAAALAASFGLGFDDDASRDRRLGNIGSEVNVTPELRSEEQTKEMGLKQRKKFKKRSGTTRERTGCLTCRQRRKKCDDNTYPICGHCRRLNLECVREAPRPVHISVGNTSTSSYQPQSHTNVSLNFHDAQPEMSTTYDAPPPLHPTALTHRRVSSSAPRGFGDLSHIAMHGVNFRISIPPCLARPPSASDDSNGGSDRRYLLKYYTQVLASLVTTNHENNAFLSVFLPMAIDSPPLLSALTAWSCASLSRFHEPYVQPLMHRRGAALRLMAESLASPEPSLAMQETLLAASLVLCSTEVINGDTEGMWLRHLEGAALIIRSAKSGQKEGPEALRGTDDGEWLLRNFAYHDVLGSVTLARPPLIRGAYWLMGEGMGERVDTYMGVGSEILAFISEISCLVVPGEEEPNGEAPMDIEEVPFEQRADELEQGLLAWTAPDAIQPGLVPLAEAWRSAALLCLYRKRRSYYHHSLHSPSSPANQLAPFIATTTSSILHQLSLVPPSSLPESGMLFPIFLAGGETRDGGEMEGIRRRLAEMEGFRGFANIGRCLEVLEEVWRCWGTGQRVKGKGKEGSGEREVGWEDVCARREWVLMLA